MNIEELEAKVKTLEDKIRTLEDIEDIKKLQRAYGFYLEHWMAEDIIDCFADGPDTSLLVAAGHYVGKENIRDFFNHGRKGVEMRKSDNGEFLHQVMQLSGIVNVAPDGKTASGRWYAFGGIFIPREGDVRRSFVSGIYENGYVKEDGIWKMLSIKWVIPYGVRIAEEWAMPEDISQPFLEGQFRGPKPDIDIDRDDLRYVSGYIFPFHYNHPVTGKPTSEAEKNERLRDVINCLCF